MSEAATGVRLQKVLAGAGVGSRRTCEQLIADGRVSVNGVTVEEMGVRVDPATAEVRVDGKHINVRSDLVYLALNKPRGVLSAMSDSRGRRTVGDLVADRPERLFHVGRLDADSEGLLLLTNDGELANVITSAATHIPKTYLVKVNGALTQEQEQQFREGVPLGGRRTAPAGLKLTHRAANPWYEVRLIEGRKNQIREMFKHFGRLVEKLKRIKIGFLELGPLKPGEFRYLTAEEVGRLRRTAPRRAAR